MYYRSDIVYQDVYNWHLLVLFYPESRLHRILVLFWGVTLPHPSVHMYKVKLTSHLALEMHLWPNLNLNNTFYESQFCLVTVWFKNGPRIQVCKIRMYEIQFWGFSLSFLRRGKENSFFSAGLGVPDIHSRAAARIETDWELIQNRGKQNQKTDKNI